MPTGQRLKQTIHFEDIAAGDTAILPHGMVVNGHGVVPDQLDLQNPDFDYVSCDETNLTVQNNGSGEASCIVLAEHWHTFERSFGLMGTGDETALDPQPFVMKSGTPSAGGGGGFVPMGSELVTSSIPTDPPINIQSRMGNGLYVDPASPAAADDLDITTPFETWQGAVDAAANLGSVNLTTGLMRRVIFVAPGCYDEDVTLPEGIPIWEFVMMGGVTLGAGRAGADGSSTTPRNLTWEISDDNLQAVAPRLIISSMTPQATGIFDSRNDSDDYAGALAMQGLLISGDLVIQDGEGAPFSGTGYLLLDSVTCTNLTETLTGGGIESTLEAVRVSSRTNAPRLTIRDGHASSFGGTDFTPANNKFGPVAGIYRMEECAFAQDFEAGFVGTGDSANFLAQDGLHNCAFGADGSTGITVTVPNPSGVAKFNIDVPSLISLMRANPVYDFTTNREFLVNGTVSEITWGNTDIGSGAGNVFLTPGFGAAAGAADDKRVRVNKGGGGMRMLILGLFVRQNLAVGDGDPVDYEVLFQGASAPTPVLVSVNSNVGSGELLTQSIISTAIDLSLRASKAGDITDGNLNVTVTLRYLNYMFA